MGPSGAKWDAGSVLRRPAIRLDHHNVTRSGLRWRMQKGRPFERPISASRLVDGDQLPRWLVWEGTIDGAELATP